MQSTLRITAITLAFFLAAFAGRTVAQGYPAKPVRIVSAYAGGAGPDLSARLIADKLSRTWGQAVIVEPRPGGNGVIAIDAVKKAEPDGHTILLAGGGHLVINPILNPSLPYDIERDFAAVAIVFQAPSFVAVSATGPYARMADIINAAKKNPGKMAVGTQYLGSQQHLASVMIELLSSTRMLHVPFREIGQLYAALVNGDVAWLLTTKATADPFVRSGKVKLIAHTASTKLESHPELPSMEESGVGRIDLTVWAGMMVPRATPAERIATLSDGINKAMAEPDFQDRIQALGLVLRPHNPSDFAQIIRSDTQAYTEIVQRGGVKVE